MRLDWRLAESLLSLYGLQAASMLLPLVMWPWLARVLGPAVTGSLAVTEAAARYAGMVVEYGYQFSATREIARFREDTAARSKVVRQVLAGQAILCAGVFAAFLLLAPLLVRVREHGALIAAALVWGLGLGLSPAWYFQGTERLRIAAGVDVACRVAAAAAIVSLVRDGSDAWLAPALNALAAAVSAAVCWRWLLAETPAGRLSVAGGIEGLRTGVQVFLFRGAVSLYTTANVLLLGMLARPEAVGYFAAAEKLVKAGVSAIYPVSQAMYPRISRLVEVDPAAARNAVCGSLRAMSALGCLIGLVLACGSSLWMPLIFGRAFAPAAPILAALAALVPVIAVSNVLGLQWMLPQRMDRQLNGALGCGALTGFVAALALAPRHEGIGMAIAALLAETAVTCGVIVTLGRSRRLPWLMGQDGEEMVQC
jgi:PST family polysaccharide transporter